MLAVGLMRSRERAGLEKGGDLLNARKLRWMPSSDPISLKRASFAFGGGAAGSCSSYADRGAHT